MKQDDVAKLVYAYAAAQVRDGDFDNIFGDVAFGAATEDQMDKAQREVAAALQKKAEGA